jgi:Ca2+-binding RTX toxin-like protein
MSGSRPVFTSPSAVKFDEEGNGIAYQGAAGINVQSWALFGPDSGDFVIDATGAIRFRDAPDFEAPRDEGRNNVYQLTVTAKNAFGEDSRDITITVLDVNEAPVFTSGATASFVEGRTVVAYQARATDPEGDSLRWTLSGTDASRFKVSSTGAVFFVEPPDAESPRDAGGNNVYDLIVTASDGALSSSRAVAITVTDVNDASSLSGFIPRLTLAENAADDALVLLSLDSQLNLGNGAIPARLVVSGLVAGDVLGVVGQGSAPGQISLGGNGEVRFGGVPFGTISGGVGAPLVVTFNGAATGTAVEALVNRLGYRTASDTPAATRVLTIDLVDTAGRSLGSPWTPGFTTLADEPLAALVPGSDSAPTFADLDGDGDADLIWGQGAGRIQSRQNNDGAFQPWSGRNPFEVFDFSFTRANAAPAFTDLNADGLPDMVFGWLDGTLFVTYHSGSNGVGATPDRFFLVGSDATGLWNLRGVDVGDYAKPAFGDVTGDGRPDLVVGNQEGLLLAWRNTAEGWVPLTGSANPFAGIDVGAHAAPALLDVDGDGRMDLVVGNLEGTLRAWRNTSTGFVEWAGAANPFAGVDVGASSTPAGVDLNRDGYADLVVGSAAGGFTVLRNDGPPGAARVTLTVTAEDDAPRFLSPNAVSFVENATGIVLQAQAVDPEGEAVTYSLAGADRDLFTIDATGAVRFRAPPDFEVPGDAGGNNVHDLQILATANGMTTTQAVTITVTDNRDYARLDGVESRVNFLESAVRGGPQRLDADVSFQRGDDAPRQLVVTGQLAGDRVMIAPTPGGITLDGAQVSFAGTAIGTWSGGAGAWLTVTLLPSVTDAAIEALIESLAFDSTAQVPPRSRDLQVSLLDRDGSVTSRIIEVAVVASLPPAPPLADVTLATVENTGTTLWQPGLPNAGGWSLEGADAALFEINPATGALRFRAAPDFERPRDADGDNIHEVTAVSGGSRTSIAVTVQNAVEQAQLGALPAQVTLAENAVNAAPAVLFGSATLAAGDDLRGARLELSGLLAEDRIGILHTGDGPGQLGFDGTTIRFGGTQVGIVTENGGGRFTVLFTTGVTEAAAQAVLRSLTYATTDDTPTATRQLRLDLVEPGEARVFATPSADPVAGLSVGAGLSAPAFFDVNGDGRLDLVSGGSNNGLRVFLATETGFTPATTAQNPFAHISVPGIYTRPAFGDLDGDGREDLVLAYGSSDQPLLAWRNTADGFVPFAESPVAGITVGGNAQGAPAFVDIDGDGRKDLVLSPDLRVWLNKPEGLVRLADGLNPLFAAGQVGGIGAPVFVDFDQDGRLDLAIGMVSGPPQVWRNTGEGYVQLTGTANPLAAFSGNAAWALAAADINRDGLVDVVTGNGTGSFRSLVQTAPGNSITVNVTPQDDPPVISQTVTHLTVREGALWTDVIFSAFDPEGGQVTFRPVGPDSGAFYMFNEPGQRGRLGSYGLDFEAPRDANRDNVYELEVRATDATGSFSSTTLVVTVTDTREITWLGGLAPQVTFTEDAAKAGPLLIDASVALIQGDRFAGGVFTVSGLLAEDVVSLRSTGNGFRQISFDGTNVRYEGEVIGTASGGVGGTFSVAFTAAAYGAAVQAMIGALTYANTSDAPTATRNLTYGLVDAVGGRLNMADQGGAFVPLPMLLDPVGHLYTEMDPRPVLVDFDGDGDLDLVMGNAYGTLDTYLNTEAGFQFLAGGSNPFRDVVGGAYTAPAFGDVDGDGFVDLVLGSAQEGLDFWRGTTDGFVAGGPSGGSFTTLAAQRLSTPVFIDFDDDGDLDLLAGSLAFSGLQAWRQTEDGFVAVDIAATPFAAITVDRAAPAVGDLDGDGDMDLVLASAAGTLRSFRNDGGTFVELTGAANPLRLVDPYLLSAAPAIGDYDGDGAVDIIRQTGSTLGSFVLEKSTTITVRISPQNDAPQGTIRFSLEDGLLTATPALTDPDGMGTIGFRWQALAGDIWAEIPGADAASFAPATGQAGQLLRAVASYTDAGGTAEQVASPAAAQVGTEAGEVLDATAAGLILFGLGGDDSLGGAGANGMAGGAGADTYSADHAADRVFEAADEGRDLVLATVSWTLGAHVENLTLLGTRGLSGTGNALNNRIDGNAGANRLEGGEGDDSLRGSGGADTLIGGMGVDWLDGGSGADRMEGGAGSDTYVVDHVRDQVMEQAGGGYDRVISSVSLTLGAELERLSLSGTAALSGTGNALGNRMDGNAGANLLDGGEGDDTLMGEAGADTLIGGLGLDWLDGGSGADRMEGGAGSDTYVVDHALDQVVEQAGGGYDRVVSRVSLTLGAELEHLSLSGPAGLSGTGNALDNRLDGNAGANILDGGEGDDTLRGDGGADTLVGGLGNDWLDGGWGADRMEGGAGNDTYVVNHALDQVVEQVGGGYDRVLTSVSLTLGAEVERLSLSGSAGLSGTGNALDNRLDGNAGANILDGGEGSDTLTGGAGHDVFRFVRGQADGDVVLDFAGQGPAAGDRLEFSGYGTVAQGASFTQTDATIWRISSADGLTVEFITLANAASLHSSDWSFV